MKRKYILTEETKFVDGYILNRIKAIRDFNGVKNGDLGGFVETKRNLSHEGDCWVYDNAMVCGYALLGGDAEVCGNAKVCGDATKIQSGEHYQPKGRA